MRAVSVALLGFLLVAAVTGVAAAEEIQIASVNGESVDDVPEVEFTPDAEIELRIAGHDESDLMLEVEVADTDYTVTPDDSGTLTVGRTVPEEGVQTMTVTATRGPETIGTAETRIEVVANPVASTRDDDSPPRPDEDSEFDSPDVDIVEINGEPAAGTVEIVDYLDNPVDITIEVDDPEAISNPQLVYNETSFSLSQDDSGVYTPRGGDIYDVEEGVAELELTTRHQGDTYTVDTVTVEFVHSDDHYEGGYWIGPGSAPDITEIDVETIDQIIRSLWGGDEPPAEENDDVESDN